MEINFNDMLFEKFKKLYGDFEEKPVDSDLQIDKPEGKAKIKLYTPSGKTKYKFEKIVSVNYLNVKIRNKDNKSLLDTANAYLFNVISADSLPLPLFSMDLDIHFDKYCHCVMDLIPLSANPEYRKIYCEPVQEVRRNYNDVVAPVKTDAQSQFNVFTSGGSIFGNIPLTYGERVYNMINEYSDLYAKFVKESGESGILKKPEIVKEGFENKTRFRRMMQSLTGIIFADMPGLYDTQQALRVMKLLM
jgi:hypothetical protein